MEVRDETEPVEFSVKLKSGGFSSGYRGGEAEPGYHARECQLLEGRYAPSGKEQGGHGKPDHHYTGHDFFFYRAHVLSLYLQRTV